MSDHTIKVFKSGVHNLLSDEIIPSDAAQDAKNWISSMGIIELARGRQLLGAEGSVGMIRGLWWGYKVDGSKVLYRKTSTKIQYWTGTAWWDVLTGLTLGAEYTFANYSSLAGSFTFINGVDGYWKLNNANPTWAIQMYSASKNFHGKILIDSGRTILWDRNDTGNKDRTGVYGSFIDRQDSTVYTTVSGEATASLTGTLAFKAGGSTRSCFGVQITITATGEVYTDNFLGQLTGSLGGYGSINYATGAYTLSNAGVGTATYRWEDSNAKGITDFTKSATRVAGEGFMFPQDQGGDAILNILIGQDGAYYSLKKQSAYKLFIDQSDTMGTDTENKPYRNDIGIPSFRAAISTSLGIVFMNTANPDNPQLTILKKNPIGGDVEPVILFPHFDFSLYDYTDCAIDTYDSYITIACKEIGSEYNNVILLCDMTTKTVDITYYPARMFAKDNGVLYIGSPITESVYKVFNGFDDEGYVIDNYWKGKGETYNADFLKKFMRWRGKGLIDPNQEVDVYISFDDSGDQLIGTISGKGTYVDYTQLHTVGSNMVGEAQIGGAATTNAYPFMCEFKVRCPKFRKRTIKYVAKGVGYVSIDYSMDFNIIPFENKLVKRFRVKAI